MGPFRRARAFLEKCGNPLDHPARRDRPDSVCRAGAKPGRGGGLDAAQGDQQDACHRDEGKLTEFNADVEEKQGRRDLSLGKPDLGEGAGKAEPVQQAEAEGRDPRAARGQALSLSALEAQEFAGEEDDRQRDHRVEDGRRKPRHTERGERQGDAVGHGERGDRFQQQPAAADDQQQREDKDQVVDAEQDVLDAEL